MQVTGMVHGARLLQFVGFPTAEVLGPAASEDEIKALIARCGSVFVKPVFKGGIGKKGKAGMVGRASDLRTALKEKERLYFAEHRVGELLAKANGVTFEGAVPADRRPSQPRPQHGYPHAGRAVPVRDLKGISESRQVAFSSPRQSR